MFTSLRFTFGCLISVIAIGTPVSRAVAQDKHNHPLLHRALYELREARTELKEEKHNFGGHREKALLATEAAVKQIDLALVGAGDNTKGFKGHAKEVYSKYEHHPHLHHALHELRVSHQEIKDAKHNFGGHREKALKDINHAIEQIELVLKHHKG